MKTISLEIIEPKKDLYFYTFKFYLYLLGIYWFAVIVITTLKPAKSDPILFKIGLIWLLVMVIISANKKTYFVAGKILLGDEYIEIEYQNKKFKLNELQDITLEIEGYRWQINVTGRIVTFSNGTNNTLSFFYNNQKFTYHFLIKNSRELNIIKEYLNN